MTRLGTRRQGFGGNGLHKRQGLRGGQIGLDRRRPAGGERPSTISGVTIAAERKAGIQRTVLRVVRVARVVLVVFVVVCFFGLANFLRGAGPEELKIAEVVVMMQIMAAILEIDIHVFG